MSNNLKRKIFRNIYSYLLFFSMVAFLVTCSMMVFVNTLSDSIGIVFTEENISIAAKLTFANVLVLSVIFTVIDALRRRFTTIKTAHHIADAAKRVVGGDFSVRIKPVSSIAADDSFNEIIDCFNKMTAELQGVEIFRNDFISNVSHEMKTPLAIMQNYGTMLAAPDLSDEKRIEYAKGVTDASKCMADMMTNILKLNRLENQQIFPQRTQYDLGEQLCECLLQYENVWEQAEIEIETDIAEDVQIDADAELLGLVWNNLLSNAFKFTENGGTVLVSLATEGDYAVVKVKDTGCGMSAEVGRHIFEKFYQGDTSHSSQGNGLGLALVKRVIDIMQGEISVKSAVGVGTEFTVKINRC